MVISHQGKLVLTQPRDWVSQLYIPSEKLVADTGRLYPPPDTIPCEGLRSSSVVFWPLVHSLNLAVKVYQSVIYKGSMT